MKRKPRHAAQSKTPQRRRLTKAEKEFVDSIKEIHLLSAVKDAQLMGLAACGITVLAGDKTRILAEEPNNLINCADCAAIASRRLQSRLPDLGNRIFHRYPHLSRKLNARK